MNQEEELAARIARLLDEGTEQLGPEQRDRLVKARRLALARHRAEPAQVWMPAWAGALSGFTERSVMGVRYLIPFAVLVLGLLGVVYLNAGGVSSEMAEIDVGLLTDELPIDAFLDQSLDSWLKRSPR